MFCFTFIRLFTSEKQLKGLQGFVAMAFDKARYLDHRQDDVVSMDAVISEVIQKPLLKEYLKQSDVELCIDISPLFASLLTPSVLQHEERAPGGVSTPQVQKSSQEDARVRKYSSSMPSSLLSSPQCTPSLKM